MAGKKTIKKTIPKESKDVEFIHDAINALDDPLFVKDSKHRWILLNDKACLLMGKPREKLIGKSDYDLFPKKQADTFWKKDENVLNSGKTNVNEEKITWHGKTHTISTKKSVFKDKKTGKKFIAGTIRDITEQKKNEEALAREKDLLNKLMDSIPDIIYIKDKNSKFVKINKEHARVLGLKKPEEAAGKSDFDFHPRKLAKKYFDDEQKIVLKGKKIIDQTEEIIRADGKKYTVSTTKIPLLDSEGKIYGLVGINRDITERKKAEEKIIEEKERAQKYLDVAGVIIVALDKDGKTTLINKKGCEILGLEQKEIIGKKWFSTFLPEKQKKEVRKVFDNIIKGKIKPSEYYENSVVTKKGKERVIAWHNSLLKDSDGNIIGTLSSGQDITEKKKAEKEKEILQKKIELYNKKLERKVKKLEKEKPRLTEKEKIVLYSITAYPDFNDRQLSEKTGIKRSTVTSIRNRLRKQDMYKIANIPSLDILGCEIITIIHGEFAKPYKERKNFVKLDNEGIVFAHTTDKDFIAMGIEKNIVSFHKIADPLIDEGKRQGIFEEAPSIVHFPLELSEMCCFFDYAPFLNNLFELEFKKERKNIKKKKIKLTRNIKEVMYAVIKHPEESSSQIAKRLRLASNTVRKIENMLREKGAVKKVAIPNLNKLRCEIISMDHIVFSSFSPSEKNKDKIKKSVETENAFLGMISNKEAISLKAFRTYVDLEEAEDDLAPLKNSNIILPEPLTEILPISKTKFFKLDFAGLTKKMLGIEENI